MKRYVWAIVIIVALVAIYEVLQKWNALPCRYQYIEYKRAYTPQNDTTTYGTYVVSYPVFSRRIMTDEAVECINSMVEKIAVQDSVDMDRLSGEFIDACKEYIDYKKSDEARYYDDEEAVIPSWYYDSQTYVLINGSKLIVTETEIDSYQGGAHSNYGSYFANYDVKTGKMLSIDDVFTDVMAVSEEVTRYFIEQYAIDDSTSLSQQGFYVEKHQLPITSNFALLPEGVLFAYNIYEIAPYAFGKSEVTVPYSALRAVMKYRPDFRKADVIRQEIISEW